MSGLVDKGSVLFSQVHLFRGGMLFYYFPYFYHCKAGRQGLALNTSTVLITRRKLTEKPG